MLAECQHINLSRLIEIYALLGIIIINNYSSKVAINPPTSAYSVTVCT